VDQWKVLRKGGEVRRLDLWVKKCIEFVKQHPILGVKLALIVVVG